MTKERISALKKRIQRRRLRRKSSLSTSQETLESETALLQHRIGNRAVQRALAQREAADGSNFNPLDPKVMEGAAQAVISANETAVRNWLSANTGRLRLLAITELVAQ